MENQAVSQRILLIALGAVLGGLGLYALGEAIRPSVAQSEGAPTMNSNGSTPPVSVTGNNNVLSFGQKGGQTANTIINHTPPSRLISPAVEKDISNELRAAGSRSVVVSGQMGDSEINQFSAQLVSILHSGGWKAQGPNVIMGFAPVTGLFILVKSQDSAPETAVILQNILKRNGIDAFGMVDPSLSPDQVVLLVGNRP
jgi:hypothetical protein